MKRPHVLSIAGFDPSAGAGVIGDIKTFEAHKVLGFGVVTALTFQNEEIIDGIRWTPKNDIFKQLATLQKKYVFEFVKIGIVESLETLDEIIFQLSHQKDKCKIVWDPVLSATSGHKFHDNIDLSNFEKICNKVYLITPNQQEVKIIYPGQDINNSCEVLSKHCNVFLKGGHSETEKGWDFLFEKKKQWKFRPAKISPYEKHGTGCVISSSIAANLAKGNTLRNSCMRAKKYTLKYIESNKGLLGYHKL